MTALILDVLLASAPAHATKQRSVVTDVPLAEEVVASDPFAERSRGVIDVDLVGGMMSTPSPATNKFAIPDRYGGLRIGYRKRLSLLRLGADVTWRSTTPVWEIGLPGPLAILSTSMGTSQSLRQVNQLAGGALVGLSLARGPVFLEPFATGGLATSMRTFFVRIADGPPIFKGFPTLGGYAGVGFDTGVQPLVFRMDWTAGYELGPPPFTARYLIGQYSVSIGLRL